MNLLIDVLPNSVKIGGREYEINSCFRHSILFELLMLDQTVGEEDKIIHALELYYPEIPHDIGQAIEQMLRFYRGGKEEASPFSEAGRNRVSKQPIYSYEHDADYIFSAFLDQYGIDLNEIDYLHWWKFKAMFKALKEDNEIVKIMGIRAMDTSKLPKEQKEYYNKMKKIHQIPISKEEKEIQDAITQALLTGGKVADLLK